VEFVRCAHCDDVIGVYEPVVVVLDGGEVRETSRAAEPNLTTRRAFHRECWAALRGGGG
jgi:hypothetical protein